jgi:isoquinoline 1-oxidoreductase alpha subunit
VEIAALPNICRCGAGPRIRRAIERASLAMSAPPADERRNSERFSNGSGDGEQSAGQ